MTAGDHGLAVGRAAQYDPRIVRTEIAIYGMSARAVKAVTGFQSGIRNVICALVS